MLSLEKRRHGSLIRSCFAALAAVFVALPAPMRGQTGADQTVTIDAAIGRVSASLRLPAAVRRPPVVCIVSTTDTTELAAALATEGIASLRMDAGQIGAETVAEWISFLRNDDRFPVVTVFGEGAPLLAAVVAARAARADGVITRGDTTAAAAEIARLVAKVGATPAESAASDARRIAAFVSAVPALGRRGARETRTAAPRRSPRRTLMAWVGAVRIGVEWGQPQKRNREIWGGIVKWNEIWMPGADEATVITTNGPIRIGSLDVPAGDHTLYSLPTADRFELIVSRDVGQFHTVYEPALVLGRVDMTLSNRSDSVEGLAFAIEPRGPAATLKLMWDTREYAVPLIAR